MKVRRRVIFLFFASLLATLALAGGTSATVPGIQVAFFQLAGPDGTGTIIGTGTIVHHGNTVAWRVSGSGLTPGLHAQHIHGPGLCSATVEAPILLPLPDLVADANGAFSASGTIRTKRALLARVGGIHWNIHASAGTVAGGGAAVSCGNAVRTR